MSRRTTTTGIARKLCGCDACGEDNKVCWKDSEGSMWRCKACRVEVMASAATDPLVEASEAKLVKETLAQFARDLETTKSQTSRLLAENVELRDELDCLRGEHAKAHERGSRLETEIQQLSQKVEAQTVTSQEENKDLRQKIEAQNVDHRKETQELRELIEAQNENQQKLLRALETQNRVPTSSQADQRNASQEKEVPHLQSEVVKNPSVALPAIDDVDTPSPNERHQINSRDKVIPNEKKKDQNVIPLRVLVDLVNSKKKDPPPPKSNDSRTKSHDLPKGEELEQLTQQQQPECGDDAALAGKESAERRNENSTAPHQSPVQSEASAGTKTGGEATLDAEATSPQYVRPAAPNTAAPIKLSGGGTKPDATQSIVSLSPFLGQNWAIRARVANKAKIRTSSGSEQRLTVTLLDESGVIGATFFDDDLTKMDRKLQNGQIYIFSRGIIRNANKKYSSVNNDYEIRFDSHSGVSAPQEPSDDLQIPMQRYNLLPLERLALRELGTCVDVAFYVSQVEGATEFNPRGSEKLVTKRIIHVADQSALTTVTLFGDDAKGSWQGGHSDLIEKGKGYLLLGARATTYQGATSLSVRRTRTLPVPSPKDGISLRPLG